MTKKKRMGEFKLGEVSWVDKPANEHTKITIIKRDGSTEQKSLADKLAGIAVQDDGPPISAHLEKSIRDAYRRIQRRKHEEENATKKKEPDPMTKITNDPTAIKSFSSFEDACAYLRNNGMTALDAQKTAARARPDLLQKYQSQEKQVDKAAMEAVEKRDNAIAKRQQIDAMVESVSLAKRCSKLDALRIVRRTNPELFADE